MGKGDKKSRKGKISMGSYGVSRPRKKSKKGASAAKNPIAKKVATQKKEAAPKKTAPKKVATKTTTAKKAPTKKAK